MFFISTLFLLQMYTDNVDDKNFSALFCFLRVCNTIFQTLKVQFVLRNIFSKTYGYFLDRISCCACAFVRWMTYIFYQFIQTDITVMWFHSLLMTFIHSFLLFRRTRSLLLALIIMRTWSIFMSVCFIVAYTCYIDVFWFFLIHRSNTRLNCFLGVFCSDALWFNSLGT